MKFILIILSQLYWVLPALIGLIVYIKTFGIVVMVISVAILVGVALLCYGISNISMWAKNELKKIR